MSTNLQRDLLALGVRPGGVLLVHSSLKALGPTAGVPAAVIEALREALGAGGTLLMPALSYATVTRENPLFDQKATPSCVGIIPETFRRMAGVRRSLHPTHSVCAVGPRTRDLLEAHGCDSTPCGPASPFRLLPDAGGQILMLGCGLKPNTSMHAIEEIAAPPYLFGEPIVYTLVREDGTRVARAYRPHGFAGWRQRYDRIEGLLGRPGLRIGAVLEAPAHLLEAASLQATALAALRRDPLAFVERC